MLKIIHSQEQYLDVDTKQYKETKMTDDEIYKECEKVWKVKNSWGFPTMNL